MAVVLIPMPSSFFQKETRIDACFDPHAPLVTRMDVSPDLYAPFIFPPGNRNGCFIQTPCLA